MANTLADYFHDYKVRVFDNLPAPVLSAVPEGTLGTTMYEYKATFETLVGESLPSSVVQVTTGNATLNGTNKNGLSVLEIPSAVTKVRYWKNSWTYYTQSIRENSTSYTSGQHMVLEEDSLIRYRCTTTGTTASSIPASWPTTLGDTKIDGGAEWTVVTNKNDSWALLGEVDPDPGQLYDIGQSVTEATVPTTDTSGRPGVIAILPKPGTIIQRAERIDFMSLFSQALQDGFDLIHKPGSVISGCAEQFVSGTTWNFTAGVMYFLGRFIDVPAGQVILTGTGTEKVGVVITPLYETSDDDTAWRCQTDEGVPAEFAGTGPDAMYFEFSWVKDTEGQINIREFIDNVPQHIVILPDYTVTERKIAQAVYDVSGSFVVDNFPLEVVEHVSNAAKCTLKINPGKAYPNGFRTITEATQTIDFDRTREVSSANNSGLDPFSIIGGSVTTTNEENFAFGAGNKYVKLQVGSGAEHTVTLTGTLSATEVKTAIEATLNAVPTDPAYDLVTCSVASGYLNIRAINGKSLSVLAVADDAYTVLGLTVGVHTPIGTRIYEINDDYIATVSDLNYKTELVEARTHNINTHIDALVNTGVVSILGASDTLVDAHDHNWDYAEGVDFAKSGNSISFSGLGGAEPAGGATYYVCYEYNKNAVKGVRTLVHVVDAKVVKGAEDGSDALTLTDATSITKVIDGTAVAGLTDIKDVVELVKVNATAGQSATQYTTPVLVKNSTGLEHATSEISWATGGTQGQTGTGQPTTGATYFVSFYMWAHTTEGNYVSADSYDMYEYIESFGTLNLRDCIDFRTTTGILPVHGEDAGLDYTYYLARIDKLVMFDTGQFSLVRGAPALNPPVPNTQTGTLEIAIIRIAPYCYTTRDAQIVSLQPMRTTQIGIQQLKEDIEVLKYTTAVNNLEKEIANHPASDDAVGIFTDALTGFGRMDLQFDKNSVTHTAALDRSAQCLLLPVTDQVEQITVSSTDSTNIIRRGNTLTLSYTPEVFDYQPYATSTVNCATDFTYENYVGLMKIDPAVDLYLDVNQLPQLNADFDNNLSPLLDFVNPIMANNITYGNWNYLNQAWYAGGGHGWNAFGYLYGRTASNQQLVPGSITRDLGDRVVDMTLIPMMRTVDDAGDPIVIKVDVSNLLPNQDHACTINGVVVNFVYDNTPTTPRGEAGTHTYQSKTTVQSDNSGRLTGYFEMPAGVPRGSVPITVFHYSSPITSTATTTFYGSGFMQNTQQTTIGMNTPEIRTNTWDEQTAFYHYNYWADPLAQSFMVKDSIKYISEVGLFFRTKHATLPISVQIRNMINGFPGPEVLASSTVEAADVVISEDASAETIFEFEHVLGFRPDNEYCIVVMPSLANTGYEMWTAKVGEADINSGIVVPTQTHDGVLFHSPNNRTWEAYTKQDAKINIYKSIFENDCQIVFDKLTGIEACILVAQVEEFCAPGTSVVWAYSLNDGASWIPFKPTIDTILEETITSISLRVDVTSLGGSYQMVEKVAGIIFLLHQTTGTAIFQNQMFADDLNYPNKVTCFMDLDTDGVNGLGERTITPYYSTDDGETWVELGVDPTYTIIAQDDPYWRYKFVTPGEATLTTASNASPIVVTSAGHGFKDNAIVTIESVSTNTAANGDWMVKNATLNTFELYDETTGLIASTGNGAGTGGTCVLKEFDDMRPRIDLITTNQARTPKVQKISFICGRVEY
jgi:hypothetical protein